MTGGGSSSGISSGSSSRSSSGSSYRSSSGSSSRISSSSSYIGAGLVAQGLSDPMMFYRFSREL